MTRDDINDMRRRLDDRLNDHLTYMHEGYDDSVTGFNDAWNVVSKFFDDLVKGLHKDSCG